MTDHGLLTPGSPRAAGLVDDDALLIALVRVETAWLAGLGRVTGDDRRVELAARLREAGDSLDADVLGGRTEEAGNPVVPLVAELRRLVPDADHATLVHRGLTSQDVLDTALMLLTRDALARLDQDLRRVEEELVALAERHRDTVMAGRTLTQYAVPVTFGLRAAQWLAAVHDAREDARRLSRTLPVQCGGAAGTLSLVAELTDDTEAVAEAFAVELGLTWPGLPWHVRRGPVTRVGDVLVQCCDALGSLAGNIAMLSRPEIGEMREGGDPARGGSSTMPQKRNPVLSVLVRSAALQAPALGAQLHLAAGQAVDERPDGAWHSEWPAWRRLLELTVTAASQAADLLEAVEVDAEAMRRRAVEAAPELLAERGDGDGDPASYLGSAGRFVDVVLARVRGGEGA